MSTHKDPNELTASEKASEKNIPLDPLKNAKDKDKPGEKEMDQAIQDEEIKEEQKRDAE